MKATVNAELLSRDGDIAPLTKFKYEVFGPIRISRGQDLSSTLIADDFWNEVDDRDNRHEGLRKAIGVYIFLVQSKKDQPYNPWYIGRTENSFEVRFHQHRKLFSKLRDLRGQTAVFLLARIDRKTGKFMRKRKDLNSNDVLETMLIDRCMELNPQLWNLAKVKFVRGLVVPGFKNAPVGKPRSSAKELSNMLSRVAPENI